MIFAIHLINGICHSFNEWVLQGPARGSASPEKVGWTRGRIDCQMVYLTLVISFFLKNEYQHEESGVDMSTP